MTPVNQTKLYDKDGIHSGNCFAACIASLLELPLWMVPPFDEFFSREDSDQWLQRASEWLERLHRKELCFVDGHPVESLPEFYIASGPAARGAKHSVVYSKGVIAHDPHPDKSGLLEVEWCLYLEDEPNPPLHLEHLR